MHKHSTWSRKELGVRDKGNECVCKMDGSWKFIICCWLGNNWLSLESIVVAITGSCKWDKLISSDFCVNKKAKFETSASSSVKIKLSSTFSIDVKSEVWRWCWLVISRFLVETTTGTPSGWCLKGWWGMLLICWVENWILLPPSPLCSPPCGDNKDRFFSSFSLWDFCLFRSIRCFYTSNLKKINNIHLKSTMQIISQLFY